MTDTATTMDAAKSVAAELGKVAAKATVQTAVELVAATALLATVGFVASKVQARKANKTATPVEESK